jgi:hypothetical protein
MPRTESNTIELGTLVPEFTLPGKNGLDVGPHSVEVKPALLVAFISNRCPFVILIREELARIGRDYAGRGLAILAVNSNDPEAPGGNRRSRCGRGGRAGLLFPLPQG